MRERHPILQEAMKEQRPMSTSTKQLLADMERTPKGAAAAVDAYLAARRHSQS